MNIELPKNIITDAVSAALLQSIDTEKRNVLIEGAIRHLLTPGKESWNRNSTPLEEAFRNAVHRTTEQIAGEMLSQNGEVKAKIQGLLNEALVRVFETNRETVVSRLADTISIALIRPNRD